MPMTASLSCIREESMRWMVKRGAATLWYVAALAWFSFVVLTVALICFRSVKMSGISSAIQFNDIPLLRHFDTTYEHYYRWATVGGLVLSTLLVAACWGRYV